MTILPIADGEDGLSVRDKLNEMIAEANALVAASPDTYYVSPSGSDLNSGITPASAWQSITQANAFAGYAAGNRIFLEANAVFNDGSLDPPIAGLTYGRYGDGDDPIISGGIFLEGNTWTDFGGTEPGCWQTIYTNPASQTPSRLSLDDARGFARGDSLANCSVDVLGTVGVSWSNAQATTSFHNPNIWQRTHAGMGTSRIPELLSINGLAPSQAKNSVEEMVAPGDWVSRTTVLYIYSTSDPSSAFTSIWLSNAWFASRSGTTVTLTLFNPGTNPSTAFSTIFANGQTTVTRLNLSVSNTTIRDIKFLGGGSSGNKLAEISSADNLFENVEFRMAFEAGVRMNDGAHRNTFIECDFSEHGLLQEQGHWGIKPGASPPTNIHETRLINCRIAWNGEDGFAPQLQGGCWIYLDNCVFENNGEEGMDTKNRTSVRAQRCTFIDGIRHAGSAGGGGAVVQDDTFAIFDDCEFRGVFNNGLRVSARTRGIASRCKFFSGDNAALNASGASTNGAQDGDWQYNACQFTTLSLDSTTSYAIALEAGDHHFRNCSINNRGTGSNADGIYISPDPGVTAMNVVAENCIIATSGTGAGGAESFVVNRNAPSASTGIKFTGTDSLYWKETNSTNWMRHNSDGGAVNTEAAIDADLAHGTYFTVTSTAVDPTANPLWTNPYRGGALSTDNRTLVLDLGDVQIGTSLWDVAYDGQTRTFTPGELITTTSGGTGYVRNDFDAGTTGTLVISEKTGTWADNDILTGSFGGLAVQNGALSNAKRLIAVPFDGQTGAFTNGLIVTGGTSGATGRLISHQDAGTTGRLGILWDSTGASFVNNDALTDTSTGAADASAAQSSSPAKAAGNTLWPAIIKDLGLTDYERARSEASSGDRFTSNATTDVITRDGVGSFVTDGWYIGAQVRVVNMGALAAGPYTATVVAAGQITFSTDIATTVSNDTDAMLTLVGPVTLGAYKAEA